MTYTAEEQWRSCPESCFSKDTTQKSALYIIHGFRYLQSNEKQLEKPWNENPAASNGLRLMLENSKEKWVLGKGYEKRKNICICIASLVAQLVKNPPAMWETWVWSLSWENSLEKGKATHSVFWTGEVHGLCSPWGCKRQWRIKEQSSKRSVLIWRYSEKSWIQIWTWRGKFVIIQR